MVYCDESIKEYFKEEGKLWLIFLPLQIEKVLVPPYSQRRKKITKLEFLMKSLEFFGFLS